MKIPSFWLPKHAAENSVPYRVATLATVLCGILATLHEELWPMFGWFVVGATIFGFWLSHVRRNMSNWWIKLILSLAMMVALYDFLYSLMYNPFDPRIPLANLLLWLQTLHSFDLPARRDLNYSLLTGFILVSVAAVLSHDMTFALFLLAFLVCSLMTLHYNYISQASENAVVVKGVDVQGASLRFPELSRMVLRMTLALLLLGGIAFLLLPRYAGMKMRPLPMSVQLKFPKRTNEEITNPAYPNMDGRVSGKQQQHFDPDNYFGFNAYMDLNLRGKLSDEIVMRVRSSEETYYRGLAFNHYNGQGWEIRDEDLKQVVAQSPPLFFHDNPGGQEVVQIFYIEKDMPNIIFSAYHISQLFFPSDTVYIDAHAGVRAGFPLEEGMVYSVISYYRPVRPRELRRLAAVLPTSWRDNRPRPPTMPYRRAAALNLQLPDGVTPRVRDLAQRLVEGKHGNYEKASAILLHLQNNYKYTLDIPPFPPNADVADQFLFEYKKGYCEQFATTMAVLCRAVDVPTRLVTGYVPGNYNPFTGYYEVKASDAHAWVEIFADRFGWVQFNPSPGYEGTPQSLKEQKQAWMLGSLVEYVKKRIGDSPLRTVLDALVRAREAAVAMMDRIGAVGTLFVSALFGLVLLLPFLYFFRRGARASAEDAGGLGALARRLGGGLAFLRRRLLGVEVPSTAEGDVADAYARMQALLEGRGVVHTKSQTPWEYRRDAVVKVPQAKAPIDTLTDQYVEARYSGRPLADEARGAAREALAGVEAAVSDVKAVPPAE